MDPYEHIDDYLKGRLSDTDKLAFESTLSHDKELRSLVDNYKEITNVSEGLLELELLNEVKEVRQTLNLGDKWKIWKIILPIILLSVIAYVAFQSGRSVKKLKKQKIYFAENYVKPENPDNVRSTDVSLLKPIDQAKYYFSLNDFERSEDILRSILDGESDPDIISEANYWMGHVKLNMYEFEEAREYFTSSAKIDINPELSFINLLLNI